MYLDGLVSFSDIISTHAPARGATTAGYGYLPEPLNFNPRSREGSDTAASGQQETIANFNPRSREGSDF